MIFHYLDEEMTPYLNKMERLTIVIHLLGFATKKQLVTITGWKEERIADTLQQIRKQGKNEAQKDKWLKIWKVSAIGATNIYSLGINSVNLAADLRKENTGRFPKKELKRGQMFHFLGGNEVLCRLIEAGAKFEDYKTGKEIMAHIKAIYKERYFDNDGNLRSRSKDYLDFKPDASVNLEGVPYGAFLEYDTGSEGRTKLGERLENYIQGYTNASKRTAKHLLPVVWVTTSEKRKKVIEEIGATVVDGYKDSYNQPVFPTMYCFVEGTETAFLLGKAPATPFMIGSDQEEEATA